VWRNCADCCPPCAKRRSNGSSGCGGRAFADGIRRAPSAAMSSVVPGKPHKLDLLGRLPCVCRACQS